ncbi:Nuclear receptor domain-containing protein [Caenorhabditis elegans]|uniref:Nuclear receptor domain-containing protein n=1 Tax=Caenorhabditis elegans TaxID=6239 RepID=Q22215_CAEEL|nr:Nuclear receptor domain-containing protein [Caenorhabditis elegans]CAA88962.1 Nuclear receptor domain-containing protein [Caenorhabditis elegans]|eukprot:NP_496409.1 Uncharacterized protein CELE_T05B9.1 [Caenorhabditis elegans]
MNTSSSADPKPDASLSSSNSKIKKEEDLEAMKEAIAQLLQGVEELTQDKLNDAKSRKKLEESMEELKSQNLDLKAQLDFQMAHFQSLFEAHEKEIADLKARQYQNNSIAAQTPPPDVRQELRSFPMVKHSRENPELRNVPVLIFSRCMLCETDEHTIHSCPIYNTNSKRYEGFKDKGLCRSCALPANSDGSATCGRNCMFSRRRCTNCWDKGGDKSYVYHLEFTCRWDERRSQRTSPFSTDHSDRSSKHPRISFDECENHHY